MIVFAVNQPLMSARPGKPPLSDRELSSWKEIAEYLNVSIRTAQAWERGRGMPVHRVPGVRGVVTASAAALDTWKHSAGNSPASAPRLRFRAWYLACAVVLGVVLYLAFFHAGRPATWRVQENTLIVSDERGRELWRHVFPEPLEPDRYVQGQRNVWIGDLGDGHQSILFAIFSEPGRTALGRRKALAGVLALRGLAQLVLADLDGKSKIYLGGVNNARKQATLVVLDPDKRARHWSLQRFNFRI